MFSDRRPEADSWVGTGHGARLLVPHLLREALPDSGCIKCPSGSALPPPPAPSLPGSWLDCEPQEDRPEAAWSPVCVSPQHQPAQDETARGLLALCFGVRRRMGSVHSRR